MCSAGASGLGDGGAAFLWALSSTESCFSLSHSAQSRSSFTFRILRFVETEDLVIPFFKNKSCKTAYVLFSKSRVWQLGRRENSSDFSGRVLGSQKLFMFVSLQLATLYIAFIIPNPLACTGRLKSSDRILGICSWLPNLTTSPETWPVDDSVNSVPQM